MAITDENGGMVMPVSPMYGGGNGGFGSSWGGDGWWIILLFLLLAGNGWGNGFGGGADGNTLYPWMNQSEQINDGFRDQMLNTSIEGIQSSLNGISTQICNGFSQAEIADNARQMANMQQTFALQSQFADCCCENRLASANLQNVIQTENCADRAAISDGIRDLLTNQTANTQRILDQLCQDKIDEKNEKIADLERQLTMANLAASQTAQTSRLLADNTAQTVALEQYLNPVPVPAYVVQNPNCCPNNCGVNCGCGCG